MHIRPFEAVFPNLNYITSPDSFFRTVKEDYPEYKESGFFINSDEEGFFLYRIDKPDRSYTGIIACAEVQDFINGDIKKHEKTLPEKEQQQLHLLLHRNAMVKPILLTYPLDKQIEDFTLKHMEAHQPAMDIYFEADQQRHFLWKLTDPKKIGELQKLFELKVPSAYIADGHHRASTMSLMHNRNLGPEHQKQYDKVLTAFFPSTELEILEYNRIVEGLGGISISRFMAKLSQVVDIDILEGPTKPANPREIVMLLNREWYLLRWKPSILEKYQEHPILLDVSLLNREILANIIGIDDVRTDERLRYMQGPKSMHLLSEKVMKSDDRIGFILHPIHMKDFIGIADANQVLPPKSTWFEPRMRNGLIAQEF